MALFASVLRDDFRPESDIDILVVFDPSARTTFMTLGKMKRELSALFQRQVDLVLQEGLIPAIRDAVLSSLQEILLLSIEKWWSRLPASYPAALF